MEEFFKENNNDSIFNLNNYNSFEIDNINDIYMNLNNSFLSDYSDDLFKVNSNFKINIIVYKDTESFIHKIQEQLKPLYFKYNFDELLNKLSSNFNTFSDSNNLTFFYLIEKIKFFIMIKEGKIEEATSHYNNVLLNLIKVVKPNNWVYKNKYFEKLIKKSNLFHQIDILNKYFDKFLYEIDKVIRNYLENKEKLNNSSIIKKNNIDLNNINNNSIENLSTQDEFSDFEDEFKPKIIEENIENYDIQKNKKNFETKEEINTNKIIKKNKKKDNKPQIIFNQIPFLSSFKPTYVKRELLDKTIIRQFRKYFIESSHKKNYGLIKQPSDNSFLILFKNQNILPPVNYVNGNTGEVVIFKSFNTKFLLWLFSKEGIKEIYFNFLRDEGNDLINEISRYYDVNDNEKEKLNYYINNLPNIFNINYVNSVTNGEYFNHIYRKNKINIRKKDYEEINTKKNKKQIERSRDNISESELNDKSIISDE